MSWRACGQVAEKCLKRAKDLSGLLLLYSARGSRPGLESLVQAPALTLFSVMPYQQQSTLLSCCYGHTCGWQWVFKHVQMLNNSLYYTKPANVIGP